MDEKKFHFKGWATKNDLVCSDGRTIRKDAFKECDGTQVPLVWNHMYDNPENVLGYVVLQNKEEGVYGYGAFNDTPSGQIAKALVSHGDIRSLSICAKSLKEQAKNVLHGVICEVSLVLRGANPGAMIESVMQHSDSQDEILLMTYDQPIELIHADTSADKDVLEKKDEKSDDATEKEETVQDVINTLTDKQKVVFYAALEEVAEAAAKGETKDDDETDNEEDEGDTIVKHNIFDKSTGAQETVLKHSDQEKILAMARSNTCGSLQSAIEIYCEENETLKHAFDDQDMKDVLFPDYKDIRPGAPELITNDMGWVGHVMSKVHKSPISRIRTRQADITTASTNMRAHGYTKGKEKKATNNIKLLKRTTDPQTVYRKDALHRDDIVDITDFDVVAYQYGIMRQNLNEEVALAVMIGDSRDEGDEAKIDENHIRPIWTDKDPYVIHKDVDIAAMKKELQGTNTGANFGDNYVYAEAVIAAALYAREQYRGSGSLEFYCTPHLLNVMLLAKDLNGRRIYSSKADLAAALNVVDIYTAEQFEGKVRTVPDTTDKKKLLGIFVNLNDYTVGSTKGGEITSFKQFDIDYNQEKYLIEARLSGALTRVRSAIVLEEPVGVSTEEDAA